ncbi:MAG: hypothetical protein JST86_09530 [Bacteroidetes bacterium]|nr:hypothetical protein [Bacteroidota bacterium]
MTKKHFIITLVVLVLSACSSTKPIPVNKQTFSFDYTPKQTAKSGSAEMVLACIRPVYGSAFTAPNAEVFQNFKNSIGTDIEELIIAKGFTLKGPYQAFGEMVYDDQKVTDMAIIIDIDPKFTAAEGSWVAHNAILGPSMTSYTYSGKVSLIGKINLTGIEPLTNQKIWSKSVSIPNVENIAIATSGKYSRPLNEIEMLQDAGVYNAVGKALQQQYEGILSKIEAHFNPEEFRSLKPQIKELKARKVF